MGNAAGMPEVVDLPGDDSSPPPASERDPRIQAGAREVDRLRRRCGFHVGHGHVAGAGGVREPAGADARLRLARDSSRAKQNGADPTSMQCRLHTCWTPRRRPCHRAWRRPLKRDRHRLRVMLQPLEDRRLLAMLTVTSPVEAPPPTAPHRAHCGGPSSRPMRPRARARSISARASRRRRRHRAVAGSARVARNTSGSDRDRRAWIAGLTVSGGGEEPGGPDRPERHGVDQRV